MRRSEREICDFNEIVKIIDECTVLRLGLADGETPYIVPVNFAYTVDGERVELYIHGAAAGRKFGMLRTASLCSFEMDIPLETDCDHGKGEITMRYKCVMGKAVVERLSGEEKKAALNDIIVPRFAGDTFVCSTDTEKTAVFRLAVTELTAKANLPKE